LHRSATLKIGFLTTSTEPTGSWTGKLAAFSEFSGNRSMGLKHAFSPSAVAKSVTDPGFNAAYDSADSTVRAIGNVRRNVMEAGAAYGHQLNRLCNSDSQAIYESGMSGDNIGRVAMGG